MIRDPRLRTARYLWLSLIVGLGGVHTAVAMSQQSMGADGINYLEIGEAFWRGELEMAVNGVWSPLYGLITGGVLTLVSPATRWVFPTVQVVNFLIFLTSLACFEFFWGELRRTYVSRQEACSGVGIGPVLWHSLGYALFLWSSLNLIEIWSVTPDMLVSATVYLGAGFLLRLVHSGGRKASIGMGLALGLGYWVKAPMFPLALVCFVLAGFATRNVSAALRRIGPGFLAFCMIAGPLMAAISLDEGHLTFSEVGRFTYLKHVNRIPYPKWRPGSGAGLGVPTHPPALVHTSPDLFSYAGPIRGSYPPSFDPDFFTEGLKPRVSVKEQGTAVAFNLGFYFRLFFRVQGAVVALAALMTVFFVRGSRFGVYAGGDWHLVLWALACFCMYTLVFVTDRYVGPFVVLFWGGFLSYWRLERNDLAAKISQAGGILIILALLLNVAALNLEGFAAVAGLDRPVEAPRSQFTDGLSASPPDVAEALRQAGVERGTDIGLIGYGFTAFWAYLADVRIVAELFPEEAQEFWLADEETKLSTLSAFQASGARYVVAEIPPDDLDTVGSWRRLGETGYLFLELPKE